ncbi:uncharacterized protein LOC141852998 [Brevipalpus obovatus]|uniref:uncharacterized protein LOC141852998 n=1 Tax=Brevipalpus obovatus TaxID=246614 RepID=UPI003D9EF813
MFPSSSTFAKTSNRTAAAMAAIINGNGSGSGTGCVSGSGVTGALITGGGVGNGNSSSGCGSSVNSLNSTGINSTNVDEYEDLMKKLTHEIESTSSNICELQVRRQQLIDKLDDIKKAYHHALEQRSHWKLSLSYGNEGNEIGQLCRPWGVAIVRMPRSLLYHYLVDEPSPLAQNSVSSSSPSNINCSSTSTSGHYSSLPGCPPLTTNTTGMISSSPSMIDHHHHHHSNQSEHHHLQQQSNPLTHLNKLTNDSLIVGAGSRAVGGGLRSGTGNNGGGGGGGLATSGNNGLSLNTNAIQTGNSSSYASMFQDNLNSASGSSSSSSSWDLDFSLLAQYLTVDDSNALFSSSPFNATSSILASSSTTNTYANCSTNLIGDTTLTSTGTSSTTGHVAAASITGISSQNSSSHQAHPLRVTSYGSDSININPSSSTLSSSSYGSKHQQAPQQQQQQQQQQQHQYFSTSLSSSSSSNQHCDPSPSSSSWNSITADLKNSITGNLSSYASMLHENLNNANDSSSPLSYWDINPLSASIVKSSSANSNNHVNNSLINGNLNGYESTNKHNNSNNVTGSCNSLINNHHNANAITSMCKGNSLRSNGDLCDLMSSSHKHYLIAIADRSNNRIQLLHLNATAMTIKVIHVFGSGPGTRAGLFDRPAGIAINTSLNHIVVADKDNHRVQVFDLKGRFQFKFGEKGNRAGQFCYPWDVDCCPSTHQLLVSDTRNRRVQLFSAYGHYITHYSHPLDSPRGVCFLGENKIVVSDFNKHRLLIFDKFQSKEDASKVIGFGEGTGWGQFLRPQGISIAGNSIFCADSRNNRICIYNILTQSFEYLSQDLNCDRPSGLHVVDNILVVVDFGNNRLQICLRN